jgi:hypothetical protein
MERKFCPLIQKKCVEHKCQWYIQLHGTNPNTGKPVDEFGCAVAFLPLLSIEIAQKSNQTGAAVESFRNVVTKQNEQQLLIQQAEVKLLPET